MIPDRFTAFADHDITAVFIEDDGVVRFEGGTLCTFDRITKPLLTTPESVFLAEDGYTWSYLAIHYGLKYGSMDKLPPLVIAAEAAALTFTSAPDLYLCPLGYLRSTTDNLLKVETQSSDLRYILNISASANILQIGPGFTELAESWYIVRPKGYLYSIPYTDAAAKTAEEDLPFENLVSAVDADKLPAWSEAEDQYYLSTYGWSKLYTFDFLLQSSAGTFLKKDYTSATSWLEIYPFDRQTANPWQEFAKLHAQFNFSYTLKIDNKDFSSNTPWGAFDHFDNTDSFYWSIPAEVDRGISICIGGSICYLMPFTVSDTPDGGNLKLDLTAEFNPCKFLEVMKYPAFDLYPQAASPVLFSIDDVQLFYSGFISVPKMPGALTSAPLQSVYISDTGSNWTFGSTLHYFGVHHSPSPGFSDESDAGRADFDLTESVANIIYIKSPGCYQNPTDNYVDPPDNPIEFIIIDPLRVERSLNLMSSATLVRADTGAVIPVTSISLNTDIQSWCWSFSATIKTAAGLALCKPTSEAPVYLLAQINGHTWPILVDGYSERGSFGKTDYSISGRTTAAELGAPMAEPASREYDTAMNLSQIMDSELLRNAGLYLPDWQGVWSAQDGLIPASTFAYQDKTPIETICTLASAVGGFVYHDLQQKTVRVAKKYKKNPWDLQQGDEDLALHPSAIISTGMTWTPAPVKDGVYVSGTTTEGYLCKVSRNGSGGLKMLSMMTDPLVVTSGIALELGRYALNQTGKKGSYSIEIPLLAPDSDMPLFTPGKIVKFYDPIHWYGIVQGISVGAAISNNVCIVRQQVTIERHFE